MSSSNDIESQINTYDSDKNNNWFNSWFECCSCCCVCLGSLTTIGALVANCVFSIIALADVSNSEIKDDCSKSNIWIYLALILILGTCNFTRSLRSLNDSNVDNSTIISYLIVHLGLVSWGAYELWGVDCVDTSTLVYTMTYINVVASYVIIGLAFGISLLIFCNK